MTWGCTIAGPYLSWSCSTADCQLHLSVLYGTMQVHYVDGATKLTPNAPKQLKVSAILLLPIVLSAKGAY